MKRNARPSLLKENVAEMTGLSLDTPSKILQAAIEVFAEVGYDGASLRQITNLAGVNHGSIKYHYNSKEDLWRTVIVFLYKELETSFRLPDEVWDSMSTREKIEHAMRGYIRFLAKNPELFKITMFETMYNSTRLDWLTENITIPYTKDSLDWVAKGKEEGIFPANIPDMNMFYILLGASRYMFFVAPEVDRSFGKNVASEKEVKRHEDAIVQLFLGHLSDTED